MELAWVTGTVTRPALLQMRRLTNKEGPCTVNQMITSVNASTSSKFFNGIQMQQACIVYALELNKLNTLNPNLDNCETTNQEDVQ